MIKEKQDSVSISVTIAAYNGQDYLYDQLMSINNQRDLPDEIAASDDNSMDETINIINAFKSISKIPLKLVINTKEQSGVIYNFLILSKIVIVNLSVIAIRMIIGRQIKYSFYAIY